MSFCVQGLHLLKKPKNQISFHRHFKVTKLKIVFFVGLVAVEALVPVDIVTSSETTLDQVDSALEEEVAEDVVDETKQWGDVAEVGVVVADQEDSR